MLYGLEHHALAPAHRHAKLCIMKSNNNKPKSQNNIKQIKAMLQAEKLEDRLELVQLTGAAEAKDSCINSSC